MAWDYYRVGPMSFIGIRILEVVTQGRLTCETVYLVRMDCCGTEMTKTHRQIMNTIQSKVRQGRTKCAACAPPKKRPNTRVAQCYSDSDAISQDTNAAMARWPKPPSVPLGGVLWGDRMGRT